jgi:hypothetical protein
VGIELHETGTSKAERSVVEDTSKPTTKMATPAVGTSVQAQANAEGNVSGETPEPTTERAPSERSTAVIQETARAAQEAVTWRRVLEYHLAYKLPV